MKTSTKVLLAAAIAGAITAPVLAQNSSTKASDNQPSSVNGCNGKTNCSGKTSCSGKSGCNGTTNQSK